jgi:CheY-like chemotaxis protein
MSRKKALVVDDIEMNRTMIKSFLFFLHYDVDMAEDGLIGFDLISKNKYDLIFSDYEMPNMNGMELLAKIRNNNENKNTPVVILSSVEKTEIIEKANRLGASDYMVKPFTKEKMDQTFKKLGLN